MTQNNPNLIGSTLKRRPEFLRDIESLSEEIGFIPAVQKTLEQDNITVEVNGDFDRLDEHEAGILFAGDHRNQWEFVALMDMLAKMNRDDMLNVAKFYVQRQVHLALGEAASRLVVPVYPRLLARDRGEFFNSETLNRILYRKFLLTLIESEEANSRAIDASVDKLTAGGIVNIFPTGSVTDSMTSPWREGIGRIITHLDSDTQQDTLVSLYNIDRISKLRLVGAVATRGRMLGKPQAMKLNLGPIESAGDLVGSLHRVDRDDPAAVTELLRTRYVDHFGSD